jgi:hypothetical protein
MRDAVGWIAGRHGVVEDAECANDLRIRIREERKLDAAAIGEMLERRGAVS